MSWSHYVVGIRLDHHLRRVGLSERVCKIIVNNKNNVIN